MILPIFLYGSPVLRREAEDVDLSATTKEEMHELFDNMAETMKNADGCGLAAPQVGISKRILIVDGNDLVDTFPDLKGFVRKMINPEIVSESEETIEYGEGCLSLPNVNADITRPKVITVHYFNEDLEEVEETFDEFAARMVQHEMDHLDGVLFTDKAAPIRKKIIAKRLQNIAQGLTRTFYKTKLEK